MQKAPKHKLLADEGFHFALTTLLRERGHDVEWIGDSASGVSDRDVFKIAQNSGRIILTEDKDFGELAIRFNIKALGVILLRVNTIDIELAEKRITELFDRFPDKLPGHFIVIDPEKFRFRKL